MKLWSKENTETSAQIEKFTVGRDNEFDQLLAEHDVTGNYCACYHVAEGRIDGCQRSRAGIEWLNTNT